MHVHPCDHMTSCDHWILNTVMTNPSTFSHCSFSIGLNMSKATGVCFFGVEGPFLLLVSTCDYTYTFTYYVCMYHINPYKGRVHINTWALINTGVQRSKVNKYQYKMQNGLALMLGQKSFIGNGKSSGVHDYEYYHNSLLCVDLFDILIH